MVYKKKIWNLVGYVIKKVWFWYKGWIRCIFYVFLSICKDMKGCI